MSAKESIGVWLRQVRGPFLILALVLTLIGVATARWHGFVHAAHSLLLAAGVLLAHAAVNLFNELSDYRTGIDSHTVRTPFSGGSGMLQLGTTTPRQVACAAYGALLGAGAVGLYFAWVSGWPILVLMACGAVAIRFYTSHLARWRIGEAASGLTLGSFVVIGVHYALVRTMTADIVYISLVPGLLTTLLLFLNEFPDAEADRRGGRRHLVIVFGTRRSAVIYAGAVLLVFALVAAGPFLLNIPHEVRIALAGLPLGAAAAALVLRHHGQPERLVPAQGLNVAMVILTDLLLALGYFL
ncbi:MAG: prenyltransferase [Candidatus Aminicenantes bacterium]|nr:prenyltransferase [Candidatus Aminicenantes bacterium]